MPQPAIVFDRVWKKFDKSANHDSLRDLLPDLARRIMGGAARGVELERQEFWALRDVSFEVHSGEALGIIGSNGAGKSTSLKLLTRILRPTRGGCRVRGRVGALIEVAAGFHPDLTGRENVYLQGAIMGMRRQEVAKKFDEIVEFAGVSEFIDAPVKRYSSGMHARLGFSVAAHLEPDVLIIDEVLAVGDMAFQQKCQRRMAEFRARGVAIVFVSHNLPAVLELCTQGLLLERGTVAKSGTPTDVVAAYTAQSGSAEEARAQGVGATITARVRTPKPDSLSSLSPGTEIRLVLQVEFTTAAEQATVGLTVWDVASRLYLYGVNSEMLGIPPARVQAGERRTYELSFSANLTRGVYAIEVQVFDLVTQVGLAQLYPLAQFTIAEDVSYKGIANLFLKGAELPAAELERPDVGRG